MDRYWGVNAFGHDASICVVEKNTVVFHKQSGDDFLNKKIIDEAYSFGVPKLICYYEKPFLKRTRQLYSGDWNKAFNLLTPKLHLMEFGVHVPIKYIKHHESHAAASYFTSDYDDSIILVADAIGEWDTVSVWRGEKNKLHEIQNYKYPFSLGLFYTAFSRLYGVSEKIFMELSVTGKPIHYEKVSLYLNKNLHTGIKDWGNIDENLPSSVQKVFVDQLKSIIKPHQKKSSTLLFTGGCAYNKLAAEELGAKVTINPGDSSSSIGAIAAHVKEKIKKQV